MQVTTAFRAIEKALASRQVGTPVAVRLMLNVATDASLANMIAATGLDVALTWLKARPSTLFARQSDAGNEVSTLVRCIAGQTVLVSAAVCRDKMPRVEITVYGNHGLLSWEGGTCDPMEYTDPISKRVGESILAWLTKSLELNTAIQLPDTESRAVQVVASVASEALSALEVSHSPTKISSPSPPYGVLLVAGDHTHQPGYAEAFVADGRCCLVGLSDEGHVSPERRALNERLASRLGIPLLPDWESALQRPDVHIVSVCAEPERRGRIIVAAARAGKHLYLDKPLAGSVEDARAIVAAVRDSGVAAHMFSQIHFDPATRVRALLDSGRLGKLWAVHSDICFAKGHGGTADLSRPRRESAQPAHFELPDAKRELTNIGVYPAVMLLALVQRKVRRVYGATGNFFFAEHQARDVEDFGQILMELDGGVTATITAGRVGWRSHPGFGLHRVCLVGSHGTAVIDAHRPRVEVWSNAEPWLPPSCDPDDPMAMWAPLPNSTFRAHPKENWVIPTDSPWLVDVRHFLDSLEQGQPSEMPVEIAAAATELLMAAYHSAATGQVVELGTSN